MSLSSLLHFSLAYGAVMIALALMNMAEFKQHAEKGERYKALPLGYKFACWFVVVPLFAGSVIRVGSLLLAIIAFLLVEGACVRWYRKAGLM